jgi:hypothetical protein
MFFLCAGALESPPEAAASFTAGHSGSAHPPLPLHQQTSTDQQQQSTVTFQGFTPPTMPSMNGKYSRPQLEGLCEAGDAVEVGDAGPDHPSSAPPVSGPGSPSQQVHPTSSNSSSYCSPPAPAACGSCGPLSSSVGGEVQLTPRLRWARGSGSGGGGGEGSEGGPSSSSPAPLLPPAVLPHLVMPVVTTVFVCVEGAAALKRRRSTCREIHQQLSTAMRDVLRFVPGGGYWCQHWAGDLKYMLAFSTPRAALEWCLLVQELTMYLPWSQNVLMAKGCVVEYDIRGKLVFRGPRLKMGMCQGVPQRVMPDHLGRADYYGPSVNQAARYMDAAAHGGQVVADLGLMKGVVKEWRETAAARGRLQQQQAAWLLMRPQEAQTGVLTGESTEQGVSSEFDAESVAAQEPTQEQQQEVKDELKINSSPELSELPSTKKHWQPAPTRLQSSASVSLPWSARPSATAHAAAGGRGPSQPTTRWNALPSKLQQEKQGDVRSRFVLTDVHTRGTLVTVHWCGMFCFKGMPEPVPMVRAECSALSGRLFPSEPPKGKGSCERVVSGVVEEAEGVLLPDLLGHHRASLAVDLVSATARPASLTTGLRLCPKSVSLSLPGAAAPGAGVKADLQRTASAGGAAGAMSTSEVVELARGKGLGPDDNGVEVSGEAADSAPPTPPASEGVSGGPLA